MMTASEARDRIATQPGQPWEADDVRALIETLERAELRGESAILAKLLRIIELLELLTLRGGPMTTSIPQIQPIPEVHRVHRQVVVSE